MRETLVPIAAGAAAIALAWWLTGLLPPMPDMLQRRLDAFREWKRNG